MQKRRILIIVLLIGILVVWRYIKKEEPPQAIELHGTTMGPIPYAIKYTDSLHRNFQSAIDSLLVNFNQSLSTYIQDSEVSDFNRMDRITYRSPYFLPILQMSAVIYENSHGAYDPTIGPLVNAWGFGPKSRMKMDSAVVDSLLSIIGFDKIDFGLKSATKPTGTYLDFSASAKGYGIDVLVDFLLSKGIGNFMVEIGGEVSCAGKTLRGSVWNIGIEKPQMNQLEGEMYATVFLKDRSMATSGNYRNYYEENGQIITHTISPFTGYSVSHHLLSATIFAKNCTLADGYATACMVLGLEKSIDMIDELEDIEGFLIYNDKLGKLKSYVSTGIKNQVKVLDR